MYISITDLQKMTIKQLKLIIKKIEKDSRIEHKKSKIGIIKDIIAYKKKIGWIH